MHIDHNKFFRSFNGCTRTYEKVHVYSCLLFLFQSIHFPYCMCLWGLGSLEPLLGNLRCFHTLGPSTNPSTLEPKVWEQGEHYV